MSRREDSASAQAGKIKTALVYPGPAAQGKASLAMAALAEQMLQGGADYERVFWDGSAGRAPSSERGRALSDFDLLFFTTAFEEQWVLVPQLLISAGIPPRAERRNATHPLIAGGGFAVRLNPGPIAPFVDIVIPSEAEAVLPAMLEEVRETKGAPRTELLDRLAEIDGLYVLPDSKARMSVLLYKGGCPVAQRKIERGSIFADMLLVETGRGCPVGCKFCAVAHSRRPARFFTPASIMEAAQEGLRPGRRVGLVGASLSRHPKLLELLTRFSDRGVDLSPASLDAAVLASKDGEKLVALLAKAGQRTLTLAPECGAESLRLEIGKTLTDEQIECAVVRLAEAGILHLKLYFMYGLPGEQPDQIEQIVRFSARVRKWMYGPQRRRGRAGRLMISANPFVPKPHTQFAKEPMAALALLKSTRARLAGGIRKIGGASFSGFSPRRAVLQCMLDRAGPEIADLLEEAQGRWPPPRELIKAHLPRLDELLAGELLLPGPRVVLE